MNQALSFLRQLAANNNREWFNENKSLYREALEEFTSVMERVLDGIREFDPHLRDISAKESIFRIYKDVRFSKDKSPYKTHFGCWMTKGGRKSEDAGYYFHLEPGATFLAGGSWMPPSARLKLIREEIMFNTKNYLDIIRDPEFISRYERTGKEDMLKKGPAGFPKDFEHLEELKYKHYVYSRNYTDKEVLTPDLAVRICEDFKAVSYTHLRAHET